MNGWIAHRVCINNGMTTRDGHPGVHLHQEKATPEACYEAIQAAYPKFFKMDVLCKWAWLGAEMLLRSGDTGLVYEGIDRNRIGVVMATASGCLEADRKYLESIQSIPSPALFVYTLPNIMLGEICIRHGFKGEQACLVQEKMDTAELCFWANDLLQNRGMVACLCGWADVTGTSAQISLFWITRNPAGSQQIPAIPEALEKLKGW